MSEKLRFQWNKFQENIKSVFQEFREDNDFADVTLACEDGQQVEAHKVILAASSPFFEETEILRICRIFGKRVIPGERAYPGLF